MMHFATRKKQSDYFGLRSLVIQKTVQPKNGIYLYLNRSTYLSFTRFFYGENTSEKRTSSVLYTAQALNHYESKRICSRQIVDIHMYRDSRFNIYIINVNFLAIACRSIQLYLVCLALRLSVYAKRRLAFDLVTQEHLGSVQYRESFHESSR